MGWSKKKAPMILQKLFFIVWGIKQSVPGAFSRSCEIVCVVNWPKLTLIGQLDSLKATLDQLQTRRHVSNKTNCCCWGLQLASFPGPRPASRRLQYDKVGEGLVRFLMWVTSWTGQIMQMWVSCKPQKNFACTHTLEHDYSESKDGSVRRHFYVTLHETVGRTESFTKPRQWRHTATI